MNHMIIKMALALAIFYGFSSISPFTAYAQTITTVSKSCGKCGKAVSSNSKIGDICPHCGVRWGYENSTTSTHTSKSYKKYTLSDYDYDPLNNGQKKSKQSPNKIQPAEKNPFSKYSKEQTENWILEKLNAYKKDYKRYYQSIINESSSISYSDFDFKFSGGYFIISYLKNNTDEMLDYIPVCNFFYIYGRDYEENFSINSTLNAIYTVRVSDNSKTTTSSSTIGFKNNSETDILKQLEFAFQQLKKLSKGVCSKSLPSFTPERIENKPNVAETQEWILQKLNKYKKDIFHGAMSIETPFGTKTSTSTDKNFNFSFNYDYWLSITYTDEFNRQRDAQIPICEVYLESNNGSLTFSSPYNKIKVDSREERRFTISFDAYGEERLEDRLLKAFANLKSYCVKSTIKEKF